MWDLGNLKSKSNTCPINVLATMGDPNSHNHKPNICYAEEEDEYDVESELINLFAGVQRHENPVAQAQANR